MALPYMIQNPIILTGSLDRPKKPFATLVFIHGETYYSGSGNAYDGSVLSSYGDVIVVTLNYRLGVLGFFSSADSVATGNYALLDIIAALHWLRENLRAFDGDPARITLMGHGHGAALVDMLLVSPMSSGGLLFKNVILQSGSSLSTWATVTDPGACMHELAERAGCKKAGYNSSVIVSCLKQAPLSTLLKAIPSSAKYLTCVGPIVSSWSGVLPKSPALLHSEPVSSYLDTTVLVGVVKHEAIEFLTDKDIQNGITSERRKQILRTFVHNSYTFQRQRIYEILDYHYTDWESSIERRSLVSSTLEYLSDGLYVTPLIEVVNLRQRANTNTYVYTFSFSQMEGVLPSWMGSIHGDELAYVFGAPVVGVLSPFRSHFARTDRITSEAIMTYWSNFAQTSNPNLPINLQTRKTDQHKRLPDVSWPKFDTSSQAYLHIGKRLKISYHYKGRKIALWLELIPKLHKSEGVPSEDNMLDFSYNLTTFDEPEKLVDFHYLLSLTPPPTTTLVPNITRNPLTNNHMDSGNRKTPINESVLGNRRKNSRNSENRRTNSERTQPKNNTLVHPLLQTRTSKVSLSITIAIGCSLLFLNILAFMGVYYQRKKAVEMFSTQKNESITMNDSDKCQATGRMGFETTSLLEPAEGLCVRLNDSLEKNGHKETRTHNFKEDMCTCDDGDYTHQQQYKHLPNNTSTNYTYRQRENHPMQATSSFSKPTRLTVKINDVPVR